MREFTMQFSLLSRKQTVTEVLQKKYSLYLDKEADKHEEVAVYAAGS